MVVISNHDILNNTILLVMSSNHDELNNTIVLVDFFIQFHKNKGFIYHKTISMHIPWPSPYDIEKSVTFHSSRSNTTLRLRRHVILFYSSEALKIFQYHMGWVIVFHQSLAFIGMSQLWREKLLILQCLLFEQCLQGASLARKGKRIHYESLMILLGKWWWCLTPHGISVWLLNRIFTFYTPTCKCRITQIQLPNKDNVIFSIYMI